MVKTIAVGLGCAAIVSACPLIGAAQNAPSAAYSLSYETSRDRFHYRFENPSTFDTVDLVPHEFTQTYWDDNQWLVAAARYRVAGRALESEIAATPQRRTRGDDYDTFFQPTGDVVVSGTTGEVSLRSVRLRQHVALGVAGGLAWHVGYQYRRDRHRFHQGQQKTVSHTQPPSTDISIVSTRETTLSETHEVRFGARRQWTPAAACRVDFVVDVAPTTNARLTTILPDKYPGREIVFSAIVLTLSPRVALSYGNRWPITLSLAGVRTFSYVHSRQFERTALTAGIGVARTF